MRTARILALFLAGSALAVSPVAAQPAHASEESALKEFRQRHEAVVEMVRNKASTSALQTEVDKLLGYDQLAKAALGGPKKYAERCADRCDEFNGLLKELIRENYLRLIRKSTDYPVEYLGEDKSKSGSSWRVRTMIKVNRNGRVQPVEVHYVMHKVGGEWQVKNIITDSVSLSKTYRYEFKKIMERDGLDGLIGKLQTKIAEVKAKK